MTQTKADRQEAAKKAAATRERNKIKDDSKQRGTKAAATRQGNAAAASLGQAREAVGSAAGSLAEAARHVGTAAVETGKSVATRTRAGG